jgi:hypothetical protein
MGLLQRFDPPAFLSDFDEIVGQRDAWDRFIGLCFESSIASESDKVLSPQGGPGLVQFYNPSAYDPGGPTIEQAILWNAFPKELLRAFGRERALREADSLWPLRAYRNQTSPGTTAFEASVYRPLTEYCEWHVMRDPDTNKIRRITFTSEPPEYWQALHGDTIVIDPKRQQSFPGDKEKLLDLYRELVSPEVNLEDLVAQDAIIDPAGMIYAEKGQYNQFNKWNTTHGIVHLCAPPNAIAAEIQLGADATVQRENSLGRKVVEPEVLICCAGYGGPDRNSDPTIGATINALARSGAMITLPNPVGLYMDHIDLEGWEAPAGLDVAECVKVVRGAPRMIERLMVEVPPESDLTVGDLKIGGVPIEYGGQVAECITVKLVGAAAQIGSVTNLPAKCTNKCCIDPNYAVSLSRNVAITTAPPPGMRAAFDHEGALSASISIQTSPRTQSYAKRSPYVRSR